MARGTQPKGTTKPAAEAAKAPAAAPAKSAAAQPAKAAPQKAAPQKKGSGHQRGSGKGSGHQKGSGTARKGSKGAARKGSSSRLPAGAKQLTFVIDCHIPAGDGILDGDALTGFQQYLLERIKVGGKTGQLGDKIKVKLEDSNIKITSYIPLSKKYLKYLTKRYLKKKTLRDWLRVVAKSKDAYELRYFNIHDQEEAEGEE